MFHKKVIQAAKPFKHDDSLHTCRLFQKYGIIRRIRPVAKVVYKAVFLRITVNIRNQVHKISIASDRNAAERMLKQTASPAIGFIDRFCIGITQIAKYLAG